MVKEQFKEADVIRKISEVWFDTQSSRDVRQQAHLNVVSNALYGQDLPKTPIPFGVLDRRMNCSRVLLPLKEREKYLAIIKPGIPYVTKIEKKERNY